MLITLKAQFHATPEQARHAAKLVGDYVCESCHQLNSITLVEHPGNIMDRVVPLALTAEEEKLNLERIKRERMLTLDREIFQLQVQLMEKQREFHATAKSKHLEET